MTTCLSQRAAIALNKLYRGSEGLMDVSPNVSPAISNVDDSIDVSIDLSNAAELNDSLSVPALPYRYVLTWVGQQPIAFLSQWVAEIIIVERSKILNLPFYAPSFLGVIYHKGSIVPLMITEAAKVEKTRTVQRPRIKETLTVVRLNQSVGKLSGVGFIVDRVIGSISHEQLSISSHLEALSESNSPTKVFHLEDIPPSVWQPR
jgi:chemotaxis signal transduction protein